MVRYRFETCWLKALSSYVLKTCVFFVNTGKNQNSLLDTVAERKETAG